ncbi:MAG: porin family protein [Myxococcota bacterium]
MTRLLTFALAVLLTTPVYAQDYARDGFAIGAGFGYAGENFDDDGVDFDDTGAIDVFGSYRFHPNFGVEARFEQTFDFEGDAGPTNVDVDISSLTINAQAFILTGQFQPYLGGGLGYAEAHIDVDGPGFGSDDDDSDPLWRLFMGLDSYVTPNVVIGAEAAYNFGVDDLDDFDYWTLNALLRYRF